MERWSLATPEPQRGALLVNNPFKKKKREKDSPSKNKFSNQSISEFPLRVSPNPRGEK
jgi:hypothetical protein